MLINKYRCSEGFENNYFLKCNYMEINWHFTGYVTTTQTCKSITESRIKLFYCILPVNDDKNSWIIKQYLQVTPSSRTVAGTLVVKPSSKDMVSLCMAQSHLLTPVFTSWISLKSKDPRSALDQYSTENLNSSLTTRLSLHRANNLQQGKANIKTQDWTRTRFVSSPVLLWSLKKPPEHWTEDTALMLSLSSKAPD